MNADVEVERKLGRRACRVALLPDCHPERHGKEEDRNFIRCFA